MQHSPALRAHDPQIRKRLLARRTIDPATGCWEWQGRRDRWGYGRITVAYRRYAVHRLSAALFLGFDLTSPLHNRPASAPTTCIPAPTTTTCVKDQQR